MPKCKNDTYLLTVQSLTGEKVRLKMKQEQMIYFITTNVLPEPVGQLSDDNMKLYLDDFSSFAIPNTKCNNCRKMITQLRDAARARLSLDFGGYEESEPNFVMKDMPDFSGMMAEVMKNAFGSHFYTETARQEPDTDGLDERKDTEQQDEAPSTMPMDHIQRELREGELCCMTQLSTRDGRITGNAIIFDIRYSHGMTIFDVITDARNIMSLSLAEMTEMFYLPKYVLSSYPNDDEYAVSNYIQDWHDARVAR